MKIVGGGTVTVLPYIVDGEGTARYRLKIVWVDSRDGKEYSKGVSWWKHIGRIKIYEATDRQQVKAILGLVGIEVE